MSRLCFLRNAKGHYSCRSYARMRVGCARRDLGIGRFCLHSVYLRCAQRVSSVCTACIFGVHSVSFGVCACAYERCTGP
eukprot:1697238-Rhodomonas_salina.1